MGGVLLWATGLKPTGDPLPHLGWGSRGIYLPVLTPTPPYFRPAPQVERWKCWGGSEAVGLFGECPLKVPVAPGRGEGLRGTLAALATLGSPICMMMSLCPVVALKI